MNSWLLLLLCCCCCCSCACGWIIPKSAWSRRCCCRDGFVVGGGGGVVLPSGLVRRTSLWSTTSDSVNHDNSTAVVVAHPLVYHNVTDNVYEEEEEEEETTIRRRRRGVGARVRGPIRFVSSESTLTKAAQVQLDRQVAAHQRQHVTALQDVTLLDPRPNATYRHHLGMTSGGGGGSSSTTVRALTEVCGVDRMTVVQARTYSPIRQGQSVLALSKPGTGKTLAALVPLIEQIFSSSSSSSSSAPQQQGISLLVLAPTRELALQLGATAQDLLTFYHHPTKQQHHQQQQALVQVVYGGTNIVANVKSLERHMPRILVATPGRFVELLNTKIRGRPFYQVLQQSVRHLFLDEADLILESFAPELETIMAKKTLPRRRQVVLVSATWHHNNNNNNNNKKKHHELLLKQIVGEPLESHLPETLLWLDCTTSPGNLTKHDKAITTTTTSSSTMATPVNQNVQEYFLALSSMHSYVDTLVSILQYELSLNANAKILVFFPAAKLVQFLSRVVVVSSLSEDENNNITNSGAGEGGGYRRRRGTANGLVPLRAIHSRMSQSQRQRVSQAFRSAATTTSSASILFSSDVSARGMDYPNVTTVLQYGLPGNREAYWHRLGRTARAGHFGKGIVVALPFEMDRPPPWLTTTMPVTMTTARKNQLKQPRMKPYPLLPLVNSSNITNKNSSEPKRLVSLSSSRDTMEQAQSAYKAFVAYYVGTRRYEPWTVLSAAQAFASSIGLTELPPLPETLSSALVD